MGVLLQGFYKSSPNNAVPSPADGEGTELFWWDQLATEANSFRQAGFTAIWLPPVLKTASGDNKGADGYGPYDDYDIGSRHQKGATSTRFGTREQLQRCVAILRANGLDVYLDMVEHHRSGDTTPFVFRYPGADGAGDIGRFQKNPSNFIPQVPRDPNLGGPPQDDFPFGREFAPLNAKPPRYVFDNLIDASDWLTRALDVQGYRLDDVKGLSTDFLRPFLNSKSMNGKFAVGEFFDGNRDLVNGWIFNPTGMQGRSSAFDFPMKFVLNAMCNNPGRFNMATLDHVGLAGISPLSAVTFVENHDTDLSIGAKIVSNKILGYAYVLTSEGYPCVYYRDYSTGPNGFGLKPGIDNLIWIHEKLAAGPTQQRFLDFNLFAYERLGGPHLLVALNNDPGNQRTVTVATGFGSNVQLHDYTGHGGDVTTDGNGNVTITVPRNDNGLGYACYSRAGQGGGFDITTLPVTQEFEGAEDLDILPALGGKVVQPCRVWCAANSAIRATLVPDTTGWSAATSITVQLLAPDGTVLAQQAVTEQTAGTPLAATAGVEGFHSFTLTAANTPAANSNPSYKLSVTYTAPTVFTAAGAAVPPASAAANAAEVGQWSAVFTLANVPIHTHVLPTGKILFWGRRVPVGDTPKGSAQPQPSTFASLNQHETHAFIWDPDDPQGPGTPTSNQPTDRNGNSINLFCSGHTFLPDGTLLVTGGHLFDSQGISSSTFYNPMTDKWSAGPDMGADSGRWYPTAVTLADGRALVLAGSHANAGTVPAAPPKAPQTSVVAVPQVLDNGNWVGITDFQGLPLYPRVHVAPNGFVFMSGPLANTYYLTNFLPPNDKAWLQIALRSGGGRDYAPSVMYDVGKIILIGGGLDLDPQDNSTAGPPGDQAEIIDLNVAQPQWTNTAPMHFARRQHNATILPDGTVLVTGGTQGPGNGSNVSGFNDLREGQPIHTSELWNSSNGQWTKMSAEAVDRCYHSTAVLLPDGRVFSGGGGEYAPENQIESNPPKDSHPDCQLFSPPYLFKGPRPVITRAPALVAYGQGFDVETPEPNQISQITWIRLPSVTHSFDQNQRINFLSFQPGTNKVTVTAPPNANVCPPGHYMLFLLNQQKVPSVASIIQILPAAMPQAAAAGAPGAAEAVGAPITFKPLAEKLLSPEEVDAAIQRTEIKPPVVVGVTPICPYGLAACWGGAYEGLKNMTGVRLVRPMPNSQDSTAFVYLDNDGLPDIVAWPADFAQIANAVHRLRGVEVNIEGLVKDLGGDTLVLQGDGARPSVLLQPIQPSDKVQWDAAKASPQPLSPDEEKAYANLAEQVTNSKGSLRARVIGPLQKSGLGYILRVRQFSIPEHAPKV